MKATLKFKVTDTPEHFIKKLLLEIIR